MTLWSVFIRGHSRMMSGQFGILGQQGSSLGAQKVGESDAASVDLCCLQTLLLIHAKVCVRIKCGLINEWNLQKNLA